MRFRNLAGIGIVVIAVLSVLPGATYANGDRTLVLQLKGTAIGEARSIPPIEATGTTEGNCFDLEAWDVRNDKMIGTASRCFTDIEKRNGGMALTDTLILNVPDGRLVSRDRISVQPIIHAPSQFTHMALSVPSSYEENLLLGSSSGRFEHHRGRSRLAGVMDLSSFQNRNEIKFDDLVVVTLLPRGNDIGQVQERLQEHGFYSGRIDGLIGPRTRQALREYQAKHGLPITGELDETTRKALAVH